MDYKVTDTQLSSIANAIRSAAGTSEPMAFPSDFISAISDMVVPSGNLSISQNGTYDVTAFVGAVVSVSGGGSDDNFLIAMGAKSGSIYDTEATFVPSSAFWSRANLTGVEMKSVISIMANAFCLCNALTTASFPLCTIVENFAFNRCYALTTLSFPLCKIVSNQAFRSCRSLTSIDFPMCTYVSSYAFANCINLTDVSLPMCSYLSTNVFESCNLTMLSLPVCSYIGNTIVRHNHSISAVYVLSSAVAGLGNSDAFHSTPIAQSSWLGYFGSIYVPSSLVDAYKSAKNWSYYSDRITAYIEE